MMMTDRHALPTDKTSACLVGRVWDPNVEGPSVITIREDAIYDISNQACTVRDLLELDDPAELVACTPGNLVGTVGEVVANSNEAHRDVSKPWLLAPVDLQAVKAVGVTFVASLLERVIEEKAGGDSARAEDMRGEIESLIGDELSSLEPGSTAAFALKEELVQRGMWSQYLEVGIGADPEIFTKAQPLSAVGYGADIGVLSTSSWNNPEPEVALAVNSSGQPVGATLANDVNLRDYEGRSALLLGKAKDNNASCAVGPFIRLFDSSFGMEDVSNMEIMLEVNGEDGFDLYGSSSMSHISRTPSDLVSHAIGPNHQYPDGLLLLLGTMFAPTEDRDNPGRGFTHRLGDKVKISTEKLGCLENTIRYSHQCAPWTIGAAYLMRNLSLRGLI